MRKHVHNLEILLVCGSLVFSVLHKCSNHRLGVFLFLVFSLVTATSTRVSLLEAAGSTRGLKMARKRLSIIRLYVVIIEIIKISRMRLAAEAV